MKINLLIILVLITVGLSCHTKKEKSKIDDIYYTCSMHPQVHSDHPGKCPICSMDLIPVSKKKVANADEIELTDDQVKLANISYEVIKNGNLKNAITLQGTIINNEKNNTSLTSRISGRIEKLYYKNIGDKIPAGSKAYDLYSEELNAAKQEYILLLKRRSSIGNNLIDFDQLTISAKRKLEFLGVSPDQIAHLEKTHKAPTITSFYNNHSGFITAINALEGSYVSQGQNIYNLSNTSTVAVEVRAYSSQLALLNISRPITVRLPDLNNMEVAGNIEFTVPEQGQNSRLNVLRVIIPNVNQKLKPGMLAYIIATETSNNTLLIPHDAVIQEQNMQMVWKITGQNVFKRVMIKTGMENNGQIQVLGGLSNGDSVVVSGAFLLNSEYKSRNGNNSMAGMKM